MLPEVGTIVPSVFAVTEGKPRGGVEMPDKTPVEKWRVRHNLSHLELSKMLGCSRQYVKNICKQGTKGVEKAFRLIHLAGGELTLADLLKPEDREQLIKEGLIKPTESVASHSVEDYNI